MSGYRGTVDSNDQLTGPFPSGVNMLVEGCFGAVFVGNTCSEAYDFATDSSSLSAPGTMNESSFRLSLDVPGNTVGNQVSWDVSAVVSGPFVPSPEPGSGFLLAIGLMGLGFVAIWRARLRQ
jgi:hypothetical protein